MFPDIQRCLCRLYRKPPTCQLLGALGEEQGDIGVTLSVYFCLQEHV